MPRSSESVAALASALAKAQAELVNPEKSLTAVIRSGRPGEAERSFRYAPLASGLDIVRKTLGQHEIATVQTTAIDPTTGMVHLTTMLAHSSGEWISSDWPVCPAVETASPQRMGAALTYARRYALFTLVGIAGEDDLDAPDLTMPPPKASGEGAPKAGTMIGQSSLISSRLPGRGKGKGGAAVAAPMSEKPVLAHVESAALRDRLVEEILQLTSEDDASSWAKSALVKKNKLVVEDSVLVETAFARRHAELLAAPVSAIESVIGSQGEQTAAVDPGASPGIDKSVLTLSEPRRYRNKEHLRFVAKQPCLVCGRQPSDPHHLRFMQPRALGRKVSDEFVVPLCRVHHSELHRGGNERGWWEAKAIDPAPAASKLWNETRGMKGTQQGRHQTIEPQRADRKSPR